MNQQQQIEYDTTVPEADGHCIFVCGDESVHIVLLDNDICLSELVLTPEEALTLAKKIEAAADAAMGII